MMIRSAILNTEFRQSEIFHLLSIENVRFSSSINVDIIFNEVVPSQAVKLLPADTFLQTSSTVNAALDQFRNCAVIVVGEVDFNQWCTWHMSFGMVTARFFLARHPSEAASIITNIVQKMKMRDKLDKQTAYFNKLKAENESAEAGRQILRNTFEAMNIPTEHIDKILDSTRSLAGFAIATSKGSLSTLQNLPSADDLKQLFSTKF